MRADVIKKETERCRKLTRYVTGPNAKSISALDTSNCKSVLIKMILIL